jgi:hypothetical protein
MKKRQFVPYIITAAAAVFFLVVALGMSGTFFGLSLKVIFIATFGFLTYRIFTWTRNLIGELPP